MSKKSLTILLVAVVLVAGSDGRNRSRAHIRRQQRLFRKSYDDQRAADERSDESGSTHSMSDGSMMNGDSMGH